MCLPELSSVRHAHEEKPAVLLLLFAARDYSPWIGLNAVKLSRVVRDGEIVVQALVDYRRACAVRIHRIGARSGDALQDRPIETNRVCYRELAFPIKSHETDYGDRSPVVGA